MAEEVVAKQVGRTRPDQLIRHDRARSAPSPRSWPARHWIWSPPLPNTATLQYPLPPPSSSAKLVQQRLCLFQIGGVEAFGEPAVDRREEVAGFVAPILIAAEPGEADGGAQFPELGLLLHGDAQGFVIHLLGGLGMPLPQQQLAFVPVQLRCELALACSFDDPQPIVQQAQTLFSLTCDLAR